MEKDVKYWNDRLNQIGWRYDLVRADLREYEKDMQECRDNIKRLKRDTDNG